MPFELVPQKTTLVLPNLFGDGFYFMQRTSAGEDADPGFQPALRVKIRGVADRVEIKVRNNGVGMPPEVRTRLFIPFLTTKPTGESVPGLGLSISDIVQQHGGGTITLDSRPRESTESTVRPPRAPHPAATDAVARGSA
ncbi:MAG: ATP-binding protein [Alphaproteobacteria bacterium]|nr:ATP-binding protein [Alphaproteobacteria bacterium]